MEIQGEQRNERGPLPPGLVVPWDDCQIDVKIERLRAEVIHLRNTLRWLVSTTGRLRRHVHAPSGGLLVPFDDFRADSGHAMDALQ